MFASSLEVCITLPQNRTTGQGREASPCVRTPRHSHHFLAFRGWHFCSLLACSVSTKSSSVPVTQPTKTLNLAPRADIPHAGLSSGRPGRCKGQHLHPCLVPSVLVPGTPANSHSGRWRLEGGSCVPSSTLLLEAAEETGRD